MKVGESLRESYNEYEMNKVAFAIFFHVVNKVIRQNSLDVYFEYSGCVV